MNLIKSRYWKNVSVVMLGTLISQALPMLFLTVLSRAFSVESVGVYILWLSVSSVMVTIATLSLEQSMYIVKTNIEVKSIFKSLFLSSALILFSIYSVNFLLLFLFDISLIPKVIEVYAFQVVVYAFMLSLLQGIYSWFIYNSKFKVLSILKVSIATLVALSQIIIIVIGCDLTDIIYTQVLITVGVIIFFQYREKLFPFVSERLLPIFDMLTLSKRFIYYSTPASVVNAFVNQLPIMLIASNYGVTFSAFYGLANKMLTVPSSLLSGSIMTVFRDEASTEYRNTGQCMIAYKKTLKSLLMISVIPFLLIYLLAEFLFVLVFGEEWRIAGLYAKYLIPFVFIGFIASPLSYTLLLVQWQGINLIWQVFLLFTCVVFFIGFDLIIAIQLYSTIYSLMYLIYLMMSYQAAKGLSNK
ncbi:lipopolysaccharide biosynthesis protein [Aeromonas veronii]